MSKTRIITDTHFNHEKLKTHSIRPENFTELLYQGWNATVNDGDTIVHLGDFLIGKKSLVRETIERLRSRKKFRFVLIRGNHDRDKSLKWWMDQGMDFACDYLAMGDALFTHEPANAIIKSNGNRPYGMLEEALPFDCKVNIHGHLHNVWDGFMDEARYQRDKELLGIDFKKQLRYPWQRLLAVEYTNYRPVELQDFLAHPEKYQATGPKVK